HKKSHALGPCSQRTRNKTPSWADRPATGYGSCPLQWARLPHLRLRMALAAGARLGPYEILSAIGAGGMGEVYRARDTKLGRDVALKVLPDSLLHDPDRLARFEREAHILAALNHPSIGHIYGFEDSTAVPALVMELVEGPTLADRIA